MGVVLRELRRGKAWRQHDAVAAAAGVSQTTESRAERGHLDTLSLRAVRALFAAVDARVELEIRWRGGAVDRVVDARHAMVVSAAAGTLEQRGGAPGRDVLGLRRARFDRPRGHTE